MRVEFEVRWLWEAGCDAEGVYRDPSLARAGEVYTRWRSIRPLISLPRVFRLEIQEREMTQEEVLAQQVKEATDADRTVGGAGAPAGTADGEGGGGHAGRRGGPDRADAGDGEPEPEAD